MRYVSLILLLAACGGSDSSSWQGSVDTLPNGTIRVTNAAQGSWTAGEGWQLVPVLSLGETDGPEELIFGAVAGLEADDAGRIYVLDRQANHLRIFGPDGAHVRSVGRTGRGPAEYQNANGLAWLTADTLVVVDQRGERYSILTREGEYVRSMPRLLGFYGWLFSGTVVDGVLYERLSVRRDTSYIPAVTRIRLHDRVPRDTLLRRAVEGPPLDGPDAPRDTVFLPNAEGPAPLILSVQSSQGGMMTGVPWAAGGVYHLDAEGGMWFGHGATFQFLHVVNGDTLRDVRLENVPSAVADAEFTAWVESRSMRRFVAMGGQLDVGSIPRTKAHFNRLYRDPDGNVWAAVPGDASASVFAIFDPEGRYLGRLTVPDAQVDPYAPIVVRDGRLYVVARDELDVQRVRVFRIERP